MKIFNKITLMHIAIFLFYIFFYTFSNYIPNNSVLGTIIVICVLVIFPLSLLCLGIISIIGDVKTIKNKSISCSKQTFIGITILWSIIPIINAIVLLVQFFTVIFILDSKSFLFFIFAGQGLESIIKDFEIMFIIMYLIFIPIIIITPITRIITAYKCFKLKQ